MLKRIRQYYYNLPVAIDKILLASIIISLFFILKAYTNHLINDYNYTFSWLLITLKITITYLLWVILTPLVYSLTKIIQSLNRFNISNLLLFLSGCIILAVCHKLIVSRLDDIVNYINGGYLKSFFGHNNMVVLVIGSFSSFIELLVIVAIFLAFDYQKKYLLNQKALIASQLNALRMQLQPHFLFNTLHSIAAMIDIDSKNAQKMLSKLGTLLRYILEYDAEQMVTVKDELGFIKDYLDLEQVRYKDRVTISYNIAKEAMHLKIPNMIFQPLVENAVKYGIIPTVENGEIKIGIQVEHNGLMQKDALVLQISNTFNTNKNYTKPDGTGTGLLNITKRLKQFYDNRYVFSADFDSPELYRAKMVLPIIE
ncbi:histidine kinase [uncultured Winogradskyella sp.]|uniref:sensor histidine kinase n=1 Tax=uncultured Winogradskyella sp. TaxID=395353 RepID=UPI002605DAEA|nr:histidine kinase [uncultured Winogradskyella sp.]